MLSLHPRLVAAADADDADADEGRACYFVAVACVSLLLFIVLAGAVSVARAVAITGAVMLLLMLVGWFAPAGRAAAPRQQPAHAAVAAVRLVHHRCSCGLSDAAIAALPAFAYHPPPPAAAAKDGDGGGGSEKPRGSSCSSVVLCAVCLEDVRAGEMVRRLPACSHLFHADCVDAWLRARRTCPLCRCELSTRTDVVAKQASDDDDDVLPPV